MDLLEYLRDVYRSVTDTFYRFTHLCAYTPKRSLTKLKFCAAILRVQFVLVSVLVMYIVHTCGLKPIIPQYNCVQVSSHARMAMLSDTASWQWLYVYPLPRHQKMLHIAYLSGMTRPSPPPSPPGYNCYVDLLPIIGSVNTQCRRWGLGTNMQLKVIKLILLSSD